MLGRRLPKALGGGSCLQLAASFNCQQFVASTAAQHVIEEKWSAGNECGVVATVSGYLCPPLLLWENKTSPCNQFRNPGPDALSWCDKLHLLYNAPKTKFYVHTVSVKLLHEIAPYG